MVKNFIKYYKPHLRLFTIDMFCALFMAGIDLLFPVATNKILKEYIPDEKVRTIILIGIILFVLYVIRFICAYIIGYYGHVMGIRIETDMRRDLFKKFQELDYQYFDDKKTGVLLSNLTTHLLDVSEMSHHAPEDLFISGIMLIGSFIILMFVNPYLTLIVFVCLALLITYSLTRRKKMLKTFKQSRTTQGELTARIEGSISGIRLTKSYNNEQYEENKFANNNNLYKRARTQAFREIGIFSSGNDFFMNITYLVALVFGGLFVIKGIGDLTYIDLTTYFLYINFLIKPISRLTNSMEQLQQGFSGIEKFYEIMTTEPQIVNNNGLEKEAYDGKIQFKNVNFHYNKSEKDHILNNFNFTINPGQKIAIVGETGVGKTTISKLVPRFYDVDQGEILVDDINIKEYNLDNLRSAIGSVEQDVIIFYGTIKENIAYGKPGATMDEIILAAKKAKIHSFIEQLPEKYETLTGERGVQLSGGQKQRIAIARLFLKNPKILILDEATSSLDNITEKQIQESFDELSKGKTTIMIAHRLSTIQSADEIIVLGKTGIIERGSHDQLVKSGGYYASLYNAIITI